MCFRARPRDLAERLKKADAEEAREVEGYLDELNEALVEAVNATGQAFFSHTKLHGRYAIRMAIGNIRSDEAHVTRAWELVREHARHLDAERRPVANRNALPPQVNARSQEP